MSTYVEIANALRERIASGTYKEGDVIPKQAELASEFSVNIKTIRHAVRVLESEGLVTSIRRRGTVVRSRPLMKRLGIERYSKNKWKLTDLVAFAADRDASGAGWSPNDQTQIVKRDKADSLIAEMLDIKKNATVVVRSRKVRHAGVPTHTLTSFYRAEDVEGTPIENPEPGPAGRGGGFAVLTDQGLEPYEIEETLRCRMPTPDEMKELELPKGEPVVILQRRTFTNNERPIEYAEGVHAASQFSWTYRFNVPE